MKASIFPLLFIAVVVCKGQNEKCDVYPKDPVIAMGDDIQVLFKAPNNGPCRPVPSYRHEKVFWRLNDVKIAESLYTLVNSTIPAVVIQNFTLGSGKVTCYIDGRKPILLGGTTIKVYFPPVKPTNVSCITIMLKSFTCYWNSGKNASSDTIYTVSRTIRNEPIEYCTSKNSPCSFKTKDLLLPTEIQVIAQNSQGGAAYSDVLNVTNIFSTVKISPPWKVMAEPLNSVELKVVWEKPMEELTEKPVDYSLVCEVRYSYQQGGSSHTVTKKYPRNAATTLELGIHVDRHCTRYNIKVRCALNNTWTPVWSDWSRDTTVISPLDVIHLRLWRKIHRPDKRGNRTVQLMWKWVPTSCDAIDGYRVSLKVENNRTQVPVPFDRAVTKASITLDKEAYTVRIAAYRSEKILSEDTTTIPAAGEVPGLLPVEDAQASSQNGQIHVSWSAPSQSPEAYMVDWSADDDDYSWQETETTNITFNGQPLRLYTIAVTPLYNNSPGQETTLQAYSEEGAPGMVSTVSVLDEETTGARVRWAAVPRRTCCGFTVNYTVFYKAGTGPELSVTVNSTLQEVHLALLRPGTNYTVRVMASSVAGGTNSSVIHFRTPLYGHNFIAKLGTFGGLGVILLLMIGLWCFIIVNKHVLKPVPNPKDSEVLSSWPSRNCQRPLLMPFEETYSYKLRISICDGDGTTPSPAPTENTQPASPDWQPDPASYVGSSGIKCTEEPSRSPPYVWECPAPEEWDRGMSIAPHSQASGESGPVSPYLKNCMLAVNGRGYLCNERKPAPCSEREIRDPQPQRPPPPMQPYISVDMIQKGLVNPM
ncbi:hypothetical protein SKAU_G00363960 [Synaphobranchus kaupii]|uniref:Fibronectin type-III domain-containing protein n=1 Tax=Synaphobranchus kaupii TaxID=118154 RepID=A0A9Q1EIY8_SYNKA|nr:hypothetical protein SKAU_G00363960 [Synaphobranchus kaupii]